MKKGLSISLIIILLASVAGPFAIFKGVQLGIKYEMKKTIFTKLQGENIDTLAVPSKHINNRYLFEKKKSWELCYKGIMFDFFDEFQQGDTTYFVGRTDHKEAKIIALLEKRTNDSIQGSTSTPVSKQLYKFFHVLGFYQENDTKEIILSAIQLKLNSVIADTRSFCHVEIPPPKNM